MLEGDRATRLAPMLIGTHSDTPLAYLETRHRWFDWPAPVATEPVRTWGQVTTSHIDRDGDRLRFVEDVSWRGHKSVDGALGISLDPQSVATGAWIELRERRRGGCVLHRRGTARLDRVGRPLQETWHSTGRCLSRSWSHTWTFDWDPWTPCRRSPQPPRSAADPSAQPLSP
ncbi:MAG TPA: hypothetical protein ENK18_16255 [Deltaproteobacteria bacterium]|nr:hypothetical protein [Deltaproteobacteria bacterium]